MSKKILRKILSLFIITNLISMSLVAAQATPAPATRSASEIYSKALDSSITRQIVKQMGEPGFYASRFLSLRKQINKTAVTPSDQVAKIGIITSIVGDMTAHAYDYYKGRKLEKQFADKLEKIKKYEEELKTSGKKVLEFQAGDADVQLDALKFLKAQAEIELKRAEMVSVVAYVSLGLSVTSKILALQEAAAEASSLGTLAASNQAACKAGKVEELEKESKTRAALGGVNEPVPWYMVPFLYMAEGIAAIEESAVYKTLSSYSKGAEYKVNQTALNAGYTEEMLVDVIYDVYKKWNVGSRNATEEINNFNKSSNEVSGIMKFIKSTRLDKIAIRYAVRTFIQANLVKLDAFSCTGVGRAVLFAHNAYIIHKTITTNKAQVDFAKHKISILDKTIKEFETNVTWTPTFNQFIDAILPSVAVAAIAPERFPIPPCATGILPNCSLKNYNLVTPEIKNYFNALPKDVQAAQNKVLSNNYSLKAALNLATGNVGYENINVDQLQAEIKVLEANALSLEKELSKNKNFAANYAPGLNKLKNEIIFPETLLASYSKSTSTEILIENTFKTSSARKEISNVENNFVVTEKVESSLAVEDKKAKSEYDDFVIETISNKDSNLFEIISNRYIQIYNRVD